MEVSPEKIKFRVQCENEWELTRFRTRKRNLQIQTALWKPRRREGHAMFKTANVIRITSIKTNFHLLNKSSWEWYVIAYYFHKSHSYHNTVFNTELFLTWHLLLEIVYLLNICQELYITILLNLIPTQGLVLGHFAQGASLRTETALPKTQLLATWPHVYHIN